MAEIFKILHSVDMLLFKNTKWPTCVYMIKHITQTVVIYILNQDTMDKNRRVNIILCVHVIFPQGYGTHAQRSGSCLAILLAGITPSIF